ncbi:nucleotidyl transferase AbiEii/AbiGii toxin family protein [Elusimicrobiota bacterium]
MIDIEQLSSFYPDNLKPFKKNILREYLQYKILEIIYDSKYLDKLVFMGGTAIRIIHSNNRFSEDLDFDNLGISKDSFMELMELIKKKLELEGYKLEIKITSRGAFKCHFKFLEILSQTGITGHKDARLIVQLDTEPQNYKYSPEKVLINKFEIFTRILSVPQDLLLSQKICAVFTRKRPMGRDFFDIVFLYGKTKPDMKYLNEKLNIKDFTDLKRKLLNKCRGIDFKQLSKDVAPFIFQPGDSKRLLFFKDYIKTKLD